ncbi:ATP-binding protein [Allomuricauda sp. NBRC 101325]|uniref:sensor histidine kinase n=1 Tax=Allomuricauda sp. NBRC 101325 TaxID=1113758 RepID=UPI0024A1A9E9|nr:ATP-binding protein [Muricauda sp. NBRC 101325]GLU45406.1 hypothetical protein Musp01_30300 [Muricauda sp. NBRC 101325]
MEESRKLDDITFSVDAGLIDRLGKELVGKSETAVSELVKNSYDADARNVEVNFINAHQKGGSLEIDDDGLGMTLNQLKSGFMTISSTDKIHEPTSPRFHRARAGRKGIGRFATQRLGRKLVIITQNLKSERAIKLTIDWEAYQINMDLTKIHNEVEEVSKIKPEGTKLIVENLRETWSDKGIERIYRYVSELFQPNYLSLEGRNHSIANQEDKSFNVKFKRTDGGQTINIASPQKLLFNKRLAEIEGSVDSNGKGTVSVTSESLGLKGEIIPVLHSNNTNNYQVIKNVNFKAYYFIYNRTDYYQGVTKLELSNILKQAKTAGGIRLYRNGFRVLPYGEPEDDWLNLDIRYAAESGLTNIPFGTNNLFGFVEIIDREGEYFQETASREGLLDTNAFIELTDFLKKGLLTARHRIMEEVTLLRNQKAGSSTSYTVLDNETSIKEELEQLDSNLKTDQVRKEIRDKVVSIRKKYALLLEELAMLRILASLGLTIGEFTHEIIQFTPTINGYISKLSELGQNNEETLSILQNLERAFANFTSYTSYFNATISENTSREVKPILISEVVKMFYNTIQEDLLKQNFVMEIESYGYDLYTTSMHISEWNSILYNLYTNAKKAIKRQGVQGKLKIVTGEEEGKIYMEFSDNGDGIPEENVDRIFNAFFTTSIPVGFDGSIEDRLTGTGLGLKIVRDIVSAYKGEIALIDPESEFATCFRIDVPKATKEELKQYGY